MQPLHNSLNTVFGKTMYLIFRNMVANADRMRIRGLLLETPRRWSLDHQLLCLTKVIASAMEFFAFLLSLIQVSTVLTKRAHVEKLFILKTDLGFKTVWGNAHIYMTTLRYTDIKWQIMVSTINGKYLWRQSMWFEKYLTWMWMWVTKNLRS